MNDYIVLDHHHDENEGVYRVVIGAPVEMHVPKLDENGEQQYGPAEPLMTRRTKMQTIQREVAVLDEDGKPKFDDDNEPVTEIIEIEVPVMNGNGPVEEEVPAFDENGEPMMLPGEPLTETIVEHVPVEDFVFAADDERWHHASNGKRRAAKDVAAEQRELVRKALDARDREHKRAQAARRSPSQMPGVGEPL